MRRLVDAPAAGAGKSLAELTPLGRAAAIIEQCRQALDDELAVIWECLEWGHPAVAFYGETNAGKSTLIEGLRLYFNGSGEGAGASIGDGSPDFTRMGTAYPCEYQGTCFDLVDVPGIEGDEAQVMAEIESAVRRAHLVFYVTADARPPQKGDQGLEGTLEKIDRQLRPQAKVWAIYNKKVQNPRQLGETLLKGDEATSLADGPHSLDAVMKQALEERYKGHITVSALPAFLALSAGLPLDERLEQRRDKFLNAIGRDVLIAISGLPTIGEKVRENVPTAAAEIAELNVRKLAVPITQAAEELEGHANDEFGGPAVVLAEQLANLRPQLERIAGGGVKGISRLTTELTDGYVRRVRKTMLDKIDAGLKDDAALKEALDEVIEREKRALPKTVEKRVSDTVERTRKSSGEALYLLREHLRETEVFQSASFAASFSHATEVNTRSGIQLGGLASSLVGGALAMFGAATGGLGLLIVGLATAALGCFNSIRRYFDSSFRQSEQKQALNRNLDALKPSLRADVAAQLAAIDKALQDYVLGLTQPLCSVEEDLCEADRHVRGAATQLRLLAGNGGELLKYAERLSSRKSFNQPNSPTVCETMA